MGYATKRVKRRRHSWANNVGRKLVLLGATGSHSFTWPNRPMWRQKLYHLELPDGSEWVGFSETAATVRAARGMGILDAKPASDGVPF